MDTSIFEFDSMQSKILENDLPVLDPLSKPLNFMPCEEVDMMDIYTFHPHLINMQMMDDTLAPVTDVFGYTGLCDPMSVDIMSGLPADAFSHSMADAIHEQNVMKLDNNDTLVHERDLAVKNYHKAMDGGDYEEAVKWENIANDRQSSLFDLWDTPRYSPYLRVPGL